MTNETKTMSVREALKACDHFLRGLAVVKEPVVDGDKVIELLRAVQAALDATWAEQEPCGCCSTCSCGTS